MFCEKQDSLVQREEEQRNYVKDLEMKIFEDKRMKQERTWRHKHQNSRDNQKWKANVLKKLDQQKRRVLFIHYLTLYVRSLSIMNLIPFSKRIGS